MPLSTFDPDRGDLMSVWLHTYVSATSRLGLAEHALQCWVASCIVGSVTVQITPGKYELLYKVGPDRPTLLPSMALRSFLLVTASFPPAVLWCTRSMHCCDGAADAAV